MKRTTSVLFLALLLPLQASASVQLDWRDDVLAHPVVTSLEQLLDSKYPNSCIPPERSDVVTECTGALPTVNKPTLFMTSCFFSLRLGCSGESALISGERQTYEIINPSGPGQSANAVIVIQDVKIQ